ncbi:MAG: preprotein translocase subunit SecG [Sphingobacteriales bacterium]|nr:MAG: preprotein translocase subunit SecG [Sphingobacteriales bacterium]
MTSILFAVLIIILCVVLAFFVLVQNPKGGGLAGSFGSLGSQVMGVKQSTDVMEKGTWVTMGLIAAICVISVATYPKMRQASSAPAAPTQQSAPAQQGGPTAPAAPAQQSAPAAPAAPATPGQ